MKVMLSEYVVRNMVEGIPVIGNLKNSHVIGLDKSGQELVDWIEEKNTLPQEIPESLLPLLKILQEKEFIETEENKRLPMKILKSAYLHVTDHCNLHCLGCYSYVDKRNKRKELSLEEYKEILDKLTAAGVGTLVISGGEPFLREDIDQICKYAKERGIENLQVISNGTMPLERYDKAIPYIDKLTISLDGFEDRISYIRDEGIMPSIEATINHCKERVETTFVATLHKKNLHLQERYMELSERLGVNFNFSLLTVKADDEIFKDFLITRKDFEDRITQKERAEKESGVPYEIPCTLECRASCEAGKSMISVSALGDVYPCHMLHQPELCLGNILKEKIETLLESDKNCLRNCTVENKKPCKECQYKYLCGGGCHARAYLENGDFSKPDSTCVMTKYGLHRYFEHIKCVYNAQ